jgi:hypothetical protein
MVRRYRKNALLPKPPLLITESADEFDALCEAFEREIEPRGIIEEMYVADIISIVWEILRLRRCKAVIVNRAFRGVLRDILERVLYKPEGGIMLVDFSTCGEADALAERWFTNTKVRKQVSELLGKFQLDESVIEAEAIRASFFDLERIDRMLASLEARRTKALRCIADYRYVLAQQLRESSDRIISAKEVRQLEESSSKHSAAA